MQDCHCSLRFHEMSILTLIGIFMVMISLTTTVARQYEMRKIEVVNGKNPTGKSDLPNLINLHNSNFWVDNHKSICNFKLTGKFIHYDSCFDFVELVSALGHHTVDCKELPYLVLFGCIHLQTGNCSEIIYANEFCTEYPLDGNSLSLPCRKNLRIDTTIFLILAGVTIILQFLYIRFIFAISKHKCINGLIQSYTWTDKEVILKLLKHSDPTVHIIKRNKENKRLDHNAETSYEKFSLIGIILLLFFIHKPEPVSANDYDSEVLNYQIQSNSSLTIGNFHFILHSSEFYYPITKLYSTSTWSYNWTYSLDCQFNRCDPYGTCLNGGTHGILNKKNRLSPDNIEMNDSIILRNCRWGNSKCWLSSGCDNIKVAVNMNRNNIADVYHIEEGFMMPHYSISESNDCKVVQIRPLASLIIPDLSIIHQFNNVWAAGPSASKRNEPELFKIGDFQWDSRNNILVHPNLITFSHSSGSGWSVEGTVSGFERQLKEYKSLPGYYRGDNYHVKDGYLVRVIDSPIDISLLCLGKSIKSLTNESCGGLVFSVSGIIGTATAVFFHVAPKFKIGNHSWNGLVPCIDKFIQIPCKSDGIIIKIPWPNQCIAKLNLSKINVAEQFGFSDITESYSKFSNVIPEERTMSANIGFLLSNWVTAPFLTTPIILAGVCLILILRR